MKRVVLVPLLVLACIGPARAADTSCEVYATGYPGNAGACRYTAAGPGTYEVEALSGFIISASSDGGTTYHTVVAHLGSHDSPATTVVVEQGDLKVNPGDIVVVAIGVGTYHDPNGTEIRYQDGHIKAGS